MKLQRYTPEIDKITSDHCRAAMVETYAEGGYWVRDDDVEALEAENAALHAECDRLTAMLTPKGTALSRFTDADGFKEDDPIERLRFFCSLAMDGQDWIDVEPFFGAVVKAMLGPQKVLSAEEVTQPGFYWWRLNKYSKWKLFEVDYSVRLPGSIPPLRRYHGDDEFIVPLEGQFIGLIKMPEV